MSSMRRLLWLAVLAGVAVLLLRRRGASGEGDTVSVGFADGSSTTLEPGSPERDVILATAAEALA
jgi:hypothetical protein